MYKPKTFLLVTCTTLCLFCLIAINNLLSLSEAALAEPEAERDISLIGERLQSLYLAGKHSGAEKFLSEQDAGGFWQDINYSDQSNNFAPQAHLDRLQEMAIAYRSTSRSDGQSIAMLRGIKNGLAYWFHKKPVATNWWFNEVGPQLALEQILILMNRDLPDSLMQAGIGYLYDPDHNPSGTKQSGQNLIWFAQEQLVRGVLTGSQSDVSNAAHSMQSVIAIAPKEGSIQPDNSFHQHGLLYMGGYGMGFLKDNVTCATIFRGTRFAYGAPQIDILSNFLLQGSRLMVRGKMLDYGAIGREISRPAGAQEAIQLIDVCEMLAKLRPDKQSEYQELEQHIQGTGLPYGFRGHKHFWNSDFTVHERSEYYTSVKMVSRRTSGAESINGENLKGFWIPFGVNYIARRGDEYAGIFPVWDWAHLPGVTCPDELPSLGPKVSQSNGFVGGVSDNHYGASAMLLDLEDGHSIHAHKSWFFFDDEFVALGAGISSAEPASVSTTLNQSLLHGDVIVDNSIIPIGQHDLKGVSWVLHDRIGYVLPAKSNLTLKSGAQIGAWSSINVLKPKHPEREDVFSVWLDHGVRPRGASYQYIVVPDTDATKLDAYSNRIPVKILANTVDVQAVENERLGTCEMVFYKPGSLRLRKDLMISVDQPCMAMLVKKGDTMTLTASSPEGPLRLNITISSAGSTKTVAIALPEGAKVGASRSTTIE
jgi:hypothetical protein